MPKILETDIGDIEFPDDFTVDQLNEWGRTQLPNLRERVQKGFFADLAARVPRDTVIQGSDSLMAGARAFQTLRDNMTVNRLRNAGAVAAMSAPVGEESAAITAATDAARAKADELDATYDQRLSQNPVFSTAAELKKTAIAQDQTNPTLEQSIPAAVSRVAPKLAEAAALEAVAGPVASVVAPAIMATRVGRMVPAMLSAGTAFGIADEGKFNPTEAAIAAGTVPAFGAGEAVATKLLERLPIKNVNLDIPDVLKFSGTIDKAEEAMALGRRIQGAPEGFAAQVEQKLGGIPIGETGRKFIEQTGGILAANGYLLAAQMPSIMSLPEGQKGPALGDFLASNAAMSLLGYLPLLGGEPSKAKPEIIRRVGEKLKEELTTKYGEPPHAPAPGLPEPPPGAPPAPPPSEFAAPVQPTAEELAAEERAAQEAIARRENQPEPAPVEPQKTAPIRRPIVPAPEPPRFRPPMPASAPITPVPQTVTPVTPPTPPLPGPPEATTPVVPEAKTERGVLNEQETVQAQKGQQAITPAGGVSVAPPVPTAKPTLPEPGTPADEFGAVYGPNLSSSAIERLRAANDQSFVIDDSPNSITTLEFRGNKIKVTSEEKTKSPFKRQGVAYLVVQPDGSTVMTGSFVRTPDSEVGAQLSNLAKDKLVSLINAGLNFKPSQPQETPNAIPVGSTTPVPLEVPPVGGQGLGGQVRNAEKPAIPQGQGETTPPAGQLEPQKKAAEEQIESDLVIKARDLVRQSSNPEQAYDQLVKLYNEMPRLGTRTAQSKTAQAYSTPPPLAYLASHLAGITPTTRALIAEPTAGNGMLLIGTGPNANIIANELDSNRLRRLIYNFPRSNYSMQDATSQEFFDRLRQAKPEHLVMNPPFGGRVEEGGTANQRFPIINAATSKTETPSIDLAIALNALETMAPNGRAVIIIGSKTGTMGPQFSPNDATRAKDYQRPEMLEFFSRFNVTDWFTVAGDLYKKMGAGWPVDVIVINGKKPTLPTTQGGFPRPWVKPPKVYTSWAELKQKLYETPSAVQPEPQTPAGPEQQPTGRLPGGRPGGPSGPTLPQPERPTGRPAERAPRVPEEPRAPAAAPEPARPPQQAQPEREVGGPAILPPSGPEPTPESVARPEHAGGAAETGAGPVGLEQGSNLLNVPFKPVSKLGGADLVAPKNLSDSMARAVTALQNETGKLVDDYVAGKLGWTKGELKERFSSAQAEAVALFIRNLENRGTGLINSDQTGVGKGRSVAAAIHYAMKNGKIPIFVTAKKQLYSDMAGRDLPSIGVKHFHPFITDSDAVWTNGQGEDVTNRHGAAKQRELMAEIARTKKLPPGVDGIFTTYDQLKSDKPQGWKEEPKAKMARKKKFIPRPDGPRFNMLRELAPNAIFILDEAHLAAGKDSNVGLSLQSILPSAAGVYYTSATFAKRPDNLSLYALGTAMKKAGLNREQLASVFANGGVPLQQALTAMLTESGEFVRREQNMEGVDFKFESTGTDPEKEAELADTYTSFLRDLFPLSEQVNAAASGMADSENQVRAEGNEVNLSNTNFGARLFNLSSQYLFSLRADATIQKALEVLKAGRKPFVAVYNTMAGPIADLQKRNLPVNFSGMLEREMVKMLEVKIKDPLAPADKKLGLKKGERLLILKPEDLPDGGRYFYKLRDQIRSTDFSQMPISPIDTIKGAIQKAGYTIGEITGRKGEVNLEGEEPKVTKRELRERNKILSDSNLAPSGFPSSPDYRTSNKS